MSAFSQVHSRILGWWHATPLPIIQEDATPTFQSWHQFDLSDGEWAHAHPPDHNTSNDDGGKKVEDSKFILLTWNVDAGAPAPDSRISAIISHIQDLNTKPDIIFLQEVSPTALKTLLENAWIRENWFSTENDTARLVSKPFTTVTLILKARFSRGQTGGAVLGSAWRVKYPTRFGRDALCCDILVPSTSRSDDRSSARIRLVNVHLDSLPVHPSLRPRQLYIISSYLRAAGNGLVAGDFNPVLPEDDGFVKDNDLTDAWEELHPGESGFTWGIDGNAPFPPSRFDKIAMLGLKAIEIQVLHPGTLGHGEHRKDHHGPLPWSDHSGLICSFEL